MPCSTARRQQHRSGIMGNLRKVWTSGGSRFWKTRWWSSPAQPSLARLKRVKFAQLAPGSFLSREKGSARAARWNGVRATSQIQPRISMEMETNEAIKQAVQAGMGLGILSLHSIELELKPGASSRSTSEHFRCCATGSSHTAANKRLSAGNRVQGIFCWPANYAISPKL